MSETRDTMRQSGFDEAAYRSMLAFVEAGRLAQDQASELLAAYETQRATAARLEARVQELTTWLADVTEVLCGERSIGVMPKTTLEAAQRLKAELGVLEAERKRLAEDASVTQAMALRRERDEARAATERAERECKVVATQADALRVERRALENVGAEAAMILAGEGPLGEGLVAGARRVVAERDEARADAARHKANTSLWRQRVQNAANALASVAPGELAEVDLVSKIERLKAAAARASAHALTGVVADWVRMIDDGTLSASQQQGLERLTALALKAEGPVLTQAVAPGQVAEDFARLDRALNAFSLGSFQDGLRESHLRAIRERAKDGERAACTWIGIPSMKGSGMPPSHRDAAISNALRVARWVVEGNSPKISEGSTEAPLKPGPALENLKAFVQGPTTSQQSLSSGYVHAMDTAALFGAQEPRIDDSPLTMQRREGFNEGAEAMRAACLLALQRVRTKYGISDASPFHEELKAAIKGATP